MPAAAVPERLSSSARPIRGKIRTALTAGLCFLLSSVALAQPPGQGSREETPRRTPIHRPAEADGTTSSLRQPVSPWGTLMLLGGIVAAVAMGGRWLRKAAPERFGGLSSSAMEVLGSSPLTPQHALHVVRVGDRVLILGTGSDGVRTLSELTDPAEAAQLMFLCRDHSAQRASRWNPLDLLTGRRSPAHTPPAPDFPQAPSLPQSAPTEAASRLHPTGRGVRAALWFWLALSSGAPLIWAQEGRLPPSIAPATGTSVREVFPSSDSQPSPWTGPAPVSPVSSTASRPLATVGDTVPPAAASPSEAPASGASPLGELLSPQGLGASLRVGLLIGVMSLAPAILLMTTCYVRIIVVLGLLRQAIGIQQFPPTQVLTALSLFLTALVMWPTWERCYREGIEPYAETAAAGPTGEADFQLALARTAGPVRNFMSRQIEATGNTAAIDLLMSYQDPARDGTAPQPAYYEEVPLPVLLPAYVLSELKTAFLIGFQIYLPFVVIDLVVSSVLASLGLGMLPPGVASLPFKLLLFVMIDGWFLTVELLLQGMAAVG